MSRNAAGKTLPSTALLGCGPMVHSAGLRAFAKCCYEAISGFGGAQGQGALIEQIQRLV
jgi:hypothetical protein